MKIAVSASGKDLNAGIDPRFGRCQYFLIVETDDMSFEPFDNENNALSGSAGIQSASFVASFNVKAVLTGNCGPKAAQVFSAAGIDVITGQTGTVQEVVKRYMQGGLSAAPGGNVEEKAGAGGRRGMSGGRGMGGGGGRGMGGGGGRGMGGGGGGKRQS